LSEALAAQELEKLFAMAPAHVGITLACSQLEAKITPAIDYLLGRTAADSQLQPTAGDQIRSPGVLRHVMRIFITHVDHCSANFNPLRFGASRREQRKR